MSSNKLYFSSEKDEKLIESVRKHGAIFDLQHSMYRDSRVRTIFGKRLQSVWKDQMTSPNASPNKPKTPQKQAQAASGGGSARGTPVKAASTATTAISAIAAPLTPQKIASPARSVAKWQWHETTIHDSGILGWMRVWRLSKLLLQANC